MLPTTVVIPVFNAAAALRRCLESVDRSVAQPRRVVVVDDASQDRDVDAVLDWAVERPGFEVHRNPRNLGFAATCNRGIAIAGESDVVLLNSDTVVAAGWLEALERCARSAPRVASVTPLSNNATIASVPRFLEDNALPDGLDVDAMAALVRRTSLRLYPALPTGVGFCLWMARAALREVGGLDEAAFAGGYGEENDWCLRAGHAGWSHRLDDATFVFHDGGKSFGAAQEARRAAAGRALRRRHPGYDTLVGAFIRANPLRAIHDNLHAHLQIREGNHLGILHISPWPFDPMARGGIQVHGGVLERELATAVDFYVAYTAGAQLRVERRLADGRQVGWAFPLEGAPAATLLWEPVIAGALGAVLDALPIELVHVHGLLGIPPTFSAEMEARGVPWVVTIHDTRMAETGDADWRRAAGALLERAERMIAPSRAALDLILRAYPGAGRAAEIIPHGAPAADSRRGKVSLHEGGRALRVAVVGSRTREKGVEVAERLARDTASDPVEWHWLGGDPSSRRLDRRFVDLGSYLRHEYARRLAEAGIDVVVLPSVVPETYSMTLSETWAAGVPVLASRVGALAERLAAGGGWTFDPGDAHAAVEILRRLAADRDEVARRAAEARAIRQPTEAGMAAAYATLYRDVIGRRPRPQRDATAGDCSALAVYQALRRATSAPWSARMQGMAGGRSTLLARFHALQQQPAYQSSPLRRFLPESIRARLQPVLDRLLGRVS